MLEIKNLQVRAGGKDILAMAGGRDVSAISQALGGIPARARELLSAR